MNSRLLTGTSFALAAGLMWGLIFVAPLLLPEYPATLLTFGRYLAFGLIAIPLAWLDRGRLQRLVRADWIEAIKLATVGNIVYYLFLSSAIQRAGGPLPTMIIGTLPAVIAISSNLRRSSTCRADNPRIPWSQLLPSVVLIVLGIALVNHVELAQLRRAPLADVSRYFTGGVLAIGAVVCWTWYPIRNAQWLREHPDHPPRLWATAQGLATLPLALAGYAGTWLFHGLTHSPFALPFGPRSMDFLLLMFAIGLFASWLGTLCWNEASRRLSTALAGQLIVFETLAGLAYAYVLRGSLPSIETLGGVTLLVAGVMWALKSATLRSQLVGQDR